MQVSLSFLVPSAISESGHAKFLASPVNVEDITEFRRESQGVPVKCALQGRSSDTVRGVDMVLGAENGVRRSSYGDDAGDVTSNMLSILGSWHCYSLGKFQEGGKTHS
jgi:hypothetical protein